LRDGRRSLVPIPQRWILALALGAALPLGSALAQAADEPNVVPLVMRTPRGGFNRMVVSITVCEPGTDRCATIDDVMVDTGSTGLRLEASAVPAWLRLPPLLGPGSRPLAECLRFVHDAAWGPLVRADVRLGGLTARQLHVQVIDDADGAQPATCARSDVRPTSNGTLGIGQHLFDCPGACRQSAEAPGTFVKDGLTWVPLVGNIDQAYRLPNSISLLPVHDNGIVIDLPSPTGGGSEIVAGTLTIGVGTAGNNQLETSGIVRLDAAGRFTTVFDGKTFPASSIDSGTETYVFDDALLPRCQGLAWAYCVTPARHFNAEMLGQDGTRTTVGLEIGDYQARRNGHAGASDDVAEAAESQSNAFVWGAPFFLGRRVFLVMEGKSVPGASGVAGPFYTVK